jgi:hypothetical protein
MRNRLSLLGTALLLAVSGVSTMAYASMCGPFYCYTGEDAMSFEIYAHAGVDNDPTWGDNWSAAHTVHNYGNGYEDWHDFARDGWLEHDDIDADHFNCPI